MDGNSTTPGPLRKSLHVPPVGTAPLTVAQALTISESAGASHFQKLPGKFKESANPENNQGRVLPNSFLCSGCV